MRRLLFLVAIVAAYLGAARVIAASVGGLVAIVGASVARTSSSDARTTGIATPDAITAQHR